MMLFFMWPFFVSESERKKEWTRMTLWLCDESQKPNPVRSHPVPLNPFRVLTIQWSTISRILSEPWYPQEGCEQEVDSVGRMWEGLRLQVFFLCLGAALWSAAAAATHRGSGPWERGHRHHLSLHRHRERGKEGQVLHRSKRGWVWNQFFVIEEYTGPDPVLVGRVSKNKGLLHPFIYIRSPSPSPYMFFS